MKKFILPFILLVLTERGITQEVQKVDNTHDPINVYGGGADPGGNSNSPGETGNGEKINTSNAPSAKVQAAIARAKEEAGIKTPKGGVYGNSIHRQDALNALYDLKREYRGKDAKFLEAEINRLSKTLDIRDEVLMLAPKGPPKKVVNAIIREKCTKRTSGIVYATLAERQQIILFLKDLKAIYTNEKRGQDATYVKGVIDRLSKSKRDIKLILPGKGPAKNVVKNIMIENGTQDATGIIYATPPQRQQIILFLKDLKAIYKSQNKREDAAYVEKKIDRISKLTSDKISG